MDRDLSQTTMRDIGMTTDGEIGDDTDRTAELTKMPWVDSHQHTQTLTWNDREKFDLSGGQAAVMIAASYYWSPYRPVTAEDVRFLWDDAIRRGRAFSRAHFYDQYIAIGIHTWSYVDNWEELAAVLPDYCAFDDVVAIGETGIESTQHTISWPVEDQRNALTAQMEVADETETPVIIHTPGSNKGAMPDVYKDNYEESNVNFTDSVLDPETAKMDAVSIDLEVKDETGLADEKVVIDHANPEVAEHVLETTDCYVGFSISAPWLRGIGPEDIAGVIDEHGSDRVIVDTDLGGSLRNDPFCIKRMMFDLARLGISVDEIRDVVYENPKAFLGIDA
jgi:predicted metal-dependent TIM-barrel fold hydrolase